MNIPNLQLVVLLAAQIEHPADNLLNAVRHNLRRNVSYVFAVSDMTEERTAEYYSWYDEIAKKAAEDLGWVGPQKFLRIVNHKLHWDYYPYLFYRVLHNNEFLTLGFRGLDVGEGIADQYEELKPQEAEVIYQLARNGAGAVVPLARRSQLKSFTDYQKSLVA